VGDDIRRWHDISGARLASKSVVADASGPHPPSVDLLTIKELGGWKTLSMVQRYAHLSPGHRHTAIERLAARKVEPDKASGAE
jgi:hypothetical protein